MGVVCRRAGDAGAGLAAKCGGKGRGATKRATDALILERTGREPGPSGITYRGIRGLRHRSAGLESLANRYSQRRQDLHGSVFYDGILDPEEPIICDIHATADYIRDAKRLADSNEDDSYDCCDIGCRDGRAG